MIKIANRSIGNNHVFVIAEAGVNHNGNFDLAIKLIDSAKTAGADAVKFQTFRAEKLVTANAPKAEYQKKTGVKESQLQMLKNLELTDKEFLKLYQYCQKSGIIFLSTPFDSESAELLKSIGLLAFKIGSGEITNFPLLKQIAKYQKPVILSTGMASIDEIDRAVAEITALNNELILLHCISSYPAPFNQVNLKVMAGLSQRYKLPIGYSDHTIGIEVPIAAAALGACVIEKHFTLDRSLPGPDHQSSLELQELKVMITSIRHIENALGNGKKKRQSAENDVAKVARKSLFAACDLYPGDLLTTQKLDVKRPEIGIRPDSIDLVLGKAINKLIIQGKPIFWEDINE